jgi:hypothetical protein
VSVAFEATPFRVGGWMERGRVDGGCLVMVNGGMIEKIVGDCW